MNQIRQNIIKNGVRNLKEFGYEHANEENILTDLVYSQFFKRMVEESIQVMRDAATVGEVTRKEVMEQLTQLLNEIKEQNNG